MVHITALLASVVILSGRVLAVPLPDSSVNEPGVRAPDGTPITDSPTSTMMDDTKLKNKNEKMGTTTMIDEYNTKKGDEGGKMMGTKTTDVYGNPMKGTTTSSDDSTPTYGSGYNKWNDGYNNCVQQCMNSYGAPPSMYTPPPSTTTYEGGGGGKALTVLVAPAQGILRYSPFAVNASVGDTIHFIWGGSPHTVTKSSILTPCNKSADAGSFASGVHNKSFEFDLQVNNTDILTYYCGVPGHCNKGMFGFINPPNAAGTPKTVASMTPSMIANSPKLATQAMYVANKTVGTPAEAWGAHMDMSNVPPELQESFIQNVWQTRLMFAANPGMLEGGLGATNPNGSPVTIPADVSLIANNFDPSSTNTNTTLPAGVGATPSSSNVAPSATAGKGTGGASGKRIASSAALGVAVLATFFVL